MKYRGFFLLVAVFLLVSFYVFSVKVKQNRFEKINFNTTSRLQYKIPARFDELFEDAAFFVSPIPSVILVGLLTIAAFVDIKKKRLRWMALVIPLAFSLLVGVEVYGKARVESPAPPYFMIKNPTTVFPKYHVIDQYSYPSGHAARALFIAGVGIFLFRKKLQQIFVASFLISFVLFISIGKIYLGHHWLSDIIGGWILASAFLSLIYGTEQS